MPFFPHVLRIALAVLILVGHGLPKMSLLLFAFPLWGAHTDPSTLSWGGLLAAILEFGAPVMMLFPRFAATGAALLAGMFFASAATSPFPFFHRKLVGVCPDVPFAIVPSKESLILIGLAFLASAYLSREAKKQAKSRADGISLSY